MKKVSTSMTRTGLSMRWVPVVDATGRTRMEMRWSAPAVIRKHVAA